MILKFTLTAILREEYRRSRNRSQIARQLLGDATL
jgi:hypothetical protein